MVYNTCVDCTEKGEYMKRLNLAVTDGVANVIEYVAEARHCTKSQAVEYAMIALAQALEERGGAPLVTVMMEKGASCYDQGKYGYLM